MILQMKLHRAGGLRGAVRSFVRSNTFRYSLLSTFLTVAAFGQCTFTVSPGPKAFVDANGAVDRAGDPLVIQVTASAQTCAWTADATDGFATVVGTPGGTGNGSVTYSIPVNSTNAARTTTLNVAGTAIALKQDLPRPHKVLTDVLPNGGPVPAISSTEST